MNHPAEEAASHAARSIEWGGWLRSVAGAGLTASQVNDWITLIAGVLTAAYTLLKIVEWFQARSARVEQTKSLERLHQLWELREARRRITAPAPLDDPQEHHKGK